MFYDALLLPLITLGDVVGNMREYTPRWLRQRKNTHKYSSHLVFAVTCGHPQVNAWGDQPTLEMVRLIVEWGGFCFLDKDKRGDFKVLSLLVIGGLKFFGSSW